jgi:hypothetical protein
VSAVAIARLAFTIVYLLSMLYSVHNVIVLAGKPRTPIGSTTISKAVAKHTLGAIIWSAGVFWLYWSGR